MDQNQNAYKDRNNPIAALGTLLTRPYLIPVSGFKAKVTINIDKGEYLVKTAESVNELDEVLKLRHDVFIHELLGKRNLFGIDMDRYDQLCDYLIVIDKRTECCVGTYRLISDLYSKDFYSESEFDLGILPSLDGIKLEIGRACIKKEYRRSNMMALLWEGIYHYIGTIRARYVFGCSSVMTTNITDIAAIHRYLVDKNYHRNDLFIKPNGKYKITRLDDDIAALSPLGLKSIHEKAESLLPRLVTDYLKFGARVCGEPALDRNFKCIDIFTILDLKELNNAYREERTAQ